MTRQSIGPPAAGADLHGKPQMDALMDSAWRGAAPPFGGETLHVGPLPLSELQRLLAAAVAELRSVFGECPLHSFEDWHEHDGYVTTAVLADWNDLSALVEAVDTLYAGRCSDDFVQRAYYDEDRNFILRIWVPEEDDDPEQFPGMSGSFDVSGAPSLLDRLHPSGVLAVREQAAAFFARRYAA